MLIYCILNDYMCIALLAKIKLETSSADILLFWDAEVWLSFELRDWCVCDGVAGWLLMTLLLYFWDVCWTAVHVDFNFNPSHKLKYEKIDFNNLRFDLRNREGDKECCHLILNTPNPYTGAKGIFWIQTLIGW